MIVIACVQSVSNVYGQHTISGDFNKGALDELGILTFAEEFAHRARATRVLLLDNKSKQGLIAEANVSPKFSEVFPHQVVFFESLLQKAACDSDTKQLGDYCLVRTDNQDTCSCGGILHEFLKQLALAFPEEQDIYLIMHPACYVRVTDYLQEWVSSPEARPSQNQTAINIYGYGHSKDWRSFVGQHG